VAGFEVLVVVVVVGAVVVLLVVEVVPPPLDVGAVVDVVDFELAALAFDNI
jgi:hypothetical protein